MHQKMDAIMYSKYKNGLQLTWLEWKQIKIWWGLEVHLRMSKKCYYRCYYFCVFLSSQVGEYLGRGDMSPIYAVK